MSVSRPASAGLRPAVGKGWLRVKRHDAISGSGNLKESQVPLRHCDTDEENKDVDSDGGIGEAALKKNSRRSQSPIKKSEFLGDRRFIASDDAVQKDVAARQPTVILWNTQNERPKANEARN